MILKVKNKLRSIFRNNIFVKKTLLRLLDCYYKYTPLIVGQLVRYPAYLKHTLNSTVIVGPGTFSFGAIFNPGALLMNDEIILLANAQKVPWFKARGKYEKFYMQGNPLIMRLDRHSNKIIEKNIVTEIIDLPQDEDYGIEDFRLFQWQGMKMINHSLVTRKKINGLIGQSGSVSALSILDEKEKTFRFYSVPKLDFPLQTFEKNWIFKEKDQQLYLFYSLNPYRVLILENEESYSFTTIINQKLPGRIIDPGNLGTMVSFSTNPIDFDEKHWLVVVHQIQYRFTGRNYVHWAVLINSATKLPVKITSRPIFTGMGARGRAPGIRYISSIVKNGREVFFFAGEGDMYVTVTRKSIDELMSLFVPI